MIEREQAQIEIIGEAPSKRDYCYMALDEDVKSGLTGLLELERQLSQGLSAEREEGAILTHTLLWSKLSDYYKSELSDLTAIVA